MSNKIIKNLKKIIIQKLFLFYFLILVLLMIKINFIRNFEFIFEGYCKSIAKSLATNKNLVNSISPGFVVNRRTKKLKDKKISSFEKNIPLKRMANLDEIESLILFLSSEYNTYITGQKIDVDGGFNSI